MGRLRRGLGWILANRKGLIRVAIAVEKVAEELGRIRAALEDDDAGQGQEEKEKG